VLAAVAVRHGHDVTLWEIDRAAAQLLARDRTGPRLVPAFRLPAEVAVADADDIAGAVAGRDMLVVAVPSEFVAATMQSAARATTVAPIVVCASKGLEPRAGATMADVIAANLTGARVGVLSGPSFAAEIARGLPARWWWRPATPRSARSCRAASAVATCASTRAATSPVYAWAAR
jgi:glycerol-3-phosphate dehydrogenase (NAD(P)+)